MEIKVIIIIHKLIYRLPWWKDNCCQLNKNVITHTQKKNSYYLSASETCFVWRDHWGASFGFGGIQWWTPVKAVIAHMHIWGRSLVWGSPGQHRNHFSDWVCQQLTWTYVWLRTNKMSPVLNGAVIVLLFMLQIMWSGLCCTAELLSALLLKLESRRDSCTVNMEPIRDRTINRKCSTLM